MQFDQLITNALLYQLSYSSKQVFDNFLTSFDYLIQGIEEKSSGVRIYSHPTCDYLITSASLCH